EFAERARESLRGIPRPAAAEWIDEDAPDPPGAWAASETAAALRGRGLPVYQLLTIEADAAPDRPQRPAFLVRELWPLLSRDEGLQWLKRLRGDGSAADQPRPWESPEAAFG